MAAVLPTKKARLRLKVNEVDLVSSGSSGFIVIPSSQKTLTMEHLAAEMTALSVRKEDAADVARIGNQLMEYMIWYLSAGYNISTKLGSFRLTAKGLLSEDELGSPPDRSRISLDVSFKMSKAMRKALDEVEWDVEIQRAENAPQLLAAMSPYDAEHPEAVRQGDSVPVLPGQACVLLGQQIKVKGDKEQVGVTLTRQDNPAERIFFPPERLYLNSPRKVGFVLPPTVPEGSVWDVTLCTQLGSHQTRLLKTPRSTTAEGLLAVGTRAIDGE